MYLKTRAHPIPRLFFHFKSSKGGIEAQQWFSLLFAIAIGFERESFDINPKGVKEEKATCAAIDAHTQ
jgi:hypothetical protein